MNVMNCEQIIAREKKILQMRKQGLTFREIALDMKISRARAHQIVKRAMKRVSQRSE